MRTAVTQKASRVAVQQETVYFQPSGGGTGFGFQSSRLGLDAEQIIQIQKGLFLCLSAVFSALQN